MKKILSAILLVMCSVPSCTAIMTNPGYTRALENYNCRKGYATCVQRVQVEVVYVTQD